MDDCARIRAHARAGDSAVVLGGGLLGLEAAKVLADRGLHVTVIHASKTLMNVQLDELGGEMLEREIERCGIFVRTARTVEAVLGDDYVEGVRLDDGKTLAADMVVLACGVRPRVEVARASGIPINQGIIVNDTLATEAPGVYAIGECAEHAAKTYGIVTPAWEQAAVLARRPLGRKPAGALPRLEALHAAQGGGRSTSPRWGASSPSWRATRSSRSSRRGAGPTAR